jgi:hypothetical protein
LAHAWESKAWRTIIFLPGVTSIPSIVEKLICLVPRDLKGHAEAGDGGAGVAAGWLNALWPMGNRFH